MKLQKLFSPLNRLLIPALLFVALLTPSLEAKTKTARGAIQPAVQQRQLAAQVWQRTELYFGSAKPDGSVVTEAQFQQFVDTEITPRFPDGLTVLTGYGQFRNSAGMIVKARR